MIARAAAVAALFLIAACGWGGSARTVPFTFERDGARFTSELTPMPRSRYADGIGDLVHSLIPQGIVGRAPAYVARRNKGLWWTKLAGGRVFYLGYNDTFVGTWTAARRTLAAAKTKPLRGAVVELRNMSTADDPRVAIDPQVPVALSSADFFAGRDPVLAAAVATALAPRPLAAAPRPRFSYDRKRPLALRLGVAQSSGAVVRQALTFDAGFGRKAGYWVHPGGSGPWPVVLFSPGFGGDATDQLPDAERLVRRGIASLMLDPPSRLLSCRPVADVRAYSAYVVGRRRALDLLAQLPGADTGRVAAVGFSFGSAVTATLAGVDHRLRAAVIQSGRAHLSTALRVGCLRLGTKRLRAFVRAYSVVDPVRYVSRAAPVALLFQNGTRDPISPRADVEAYVRAASSPKELRWYDATHELDDRATSERDEWLERELRR